MSWSQCGEEDEVIRRYFSSTRNGTFVELGALDGATYSNTKRLEDEFGWTGVLIEPHPIAFQLLRVNRRNCALYNCAVGCVDSVSLCINPRTPAVSSVQGASGESFYKEWHPSSTTVVVPCRRLSDILQEAGRTTVDFLSLDVEGYELEVLESIDWSVIRIEVILIEMLSDNPEKNQQCRALLTDQGYIHDGFAAHNELWVRRDTKYRCVP